MEELYLEAADRWKEHVRGERRIPARDIENFELLFAYHSAKIDDAAVSFSDMRELFVRDRTPLTSDARLIRQMRNQRACRDVMRMALNPDFQVDAAFACLLNTTLTAGLGFGVGVSQGDLARLEELLREVDAYSGESVLKAAAYLHGAFLYLCPFDRFNGRTARALTACYLISRGNPPFIFYSFDRSLYLECVERYFDYEELTPLYRFFRYETGKSWIKHPDTAQLCEAR